MTKPYITRCVKRWRANNPDAFKAQKDRAYIKLKAKRLLEKQWEKISAEFRNILF
jgi:hypothetical protein